MSGRIRRLDDGIYRAERAAVAAMLVVMGVVVFLDVAHRVSTEQDGLFALWKVGPWGLAPSPLVTVLAVTVSVGALLTRSVPGAVVKGVAVGLVVSVLQVLLVASLPNGLVWSQTLALSLTLWLGTVGASLAAHDRRHLAMDVGAKLWPAGWVRYVTAVGHLVTAAFCVLLCGLGARSVAANWDLWIQTGGAGGNLAGLDIPKWFPALALPYGMVMLAFRFTFDAWLTWRGEVEVSDDDTLHLLGITVGDEGAP